jgi:hypothetical protein
MNVRGNDEWIEQTSVFKSQSAPVQAVDGLGHVPEDDCITCADCMRMIAPLSEGCVLAFWQGSISSSDVNIPIGI